LITEIELKTFATKSVKLPVFTGYISRGLALHMLRSVNPSLSQYLHQPNVMKPYSVTPLYFKSSRKYADGYEIDVSSPCLFKIKILDDTVARAVMDFLASNESIYILDTMFKTSSIIVKTEDFTKVQDSKLIRIDFDSPTHLSKISSKFDTLFPDPSSLFPNLMRIWDSCTDDKFGKEVHMRYKTWVEKNVIVSAYNLRTLTVFSGKNMKIGFIGWSNYRIDDEKNSEFGLTTNKLAKFAEYSNVGMERTAGFGVVRYSTKK
jgi:CRISPR-associated endoribonuclease Cas6